MKFIIEDMKGVNYNIEASSKSKIRKIKQIIEIRTGLSPNHIELVIPG
jgi:hypothetical protein